MSREGNSGQCRARHIESEQELFTYHFNGLLRPYTEVSTNVSSTSIATSGMCFVSNSSIEARKMKHSDVEWFVQGHIGS